MFSSGAGYERTLELRSTKQRTQDEPMNSQEHFNAARALRDDLLSDRMEVIRGKMVAFNEGARWAEIADHCVKAESALRNEKKTLLNFDMRWLDVVDSLRWKASAQVDEGTITEE
jgi:hypothetical protein